MSTRRALIAGATGLVGNWCLETLLSDSLYERVFVLARRALPQTHPKLETRTVDFDRLKETAGTLEVDDVYCCLGTTIRVAGSQEAFRKVDHDYVVNVAQLGLTAGAKRLMLVSSVGADATSSNFYLRVKGEAERDVAALGYTQVEIARPGMLLGNRSEFRLGERVATPLLKATAWMMVGGAQKYRSIESRDVARALVSAARSEVSGVRIHHYGSLRELSALLNAASA